MPSSRTDASIPPGRSAAESHDVADRRGWPPCRNLVGVDFAGSGTQPDYPTILPA